MVEYIKSLYDDSISGIFGDNNRRYEYFLGNPVNPNVTVSHKATVDCVIPVKAEMGSVLHVLDDGKSFDINFDGETSMNARWIRVNAGKEISFSSDKKFFLGSPISLVQEQAHKHKLVLFILIDSLAQTSLEEDGFENLMPYTSEFFSDALYMQDCYCCSDWTLPACATIFTGKYPCEHKMVHPAGGELKHETFVKLFKEAGYLTGYFNSSWRMPPEYGYIDGFDRGVYCHGQYRGKCIELIENVMDHIYAFPERDHFITLGLYDLHAHFFAELPHEIGLQVNESLEEHAFRRDGKKKSPGKIYTPTLASIYKRQLKLMDYKLQVLYDFVSKQYKKDECVVLFCADHGESYLSPPDFHLHAHSLGDSKQGDSENRRNNNTYCLAPWKTAMLYIYRKTGPLRLFLKHCSLGEHFTKGETWGFFRKKLGGMMREEMNKDILLNTAWPHFQNSMQKTPLIIKMSSVTGENCDNLTDLRSVYDIFSALLLQKGNLNNAMIKDICKCTYVYNESIYPGQTYKAKIIDDKYIFWFESNELVSINCTLDNLGGYSSLFSRETNKEILDKENIIEKYNSIIQNHISSLRS